MTHPLSYADAGLSRGRRHGPGIVSCGLGLVAGLLLGYAAWREFGTNSPIALGICIIASAPTGLGLLLAVTGLFWRSHSRYAAAGLDVNLVVAAALLGLAFLVMHGLD